MLVRDPLESAIEEQVDLLGYELVEIERAGTSRRPLLRLRIDRADSAPGQGVTLDECVLVSRSLELFLEERATVPEQYVLEVSSPGVERPLVRGRDFKRFAGHEIAITGKRALSGSSRRIQGELLGADGEEGAERIRLRLDSGDEVEVRREDTTRINLVYRWGEEGR